jgi:hypothetical protein
MNLEELKKISRLALMKELIEKTTNCGLIWNKIKPTCYHAQYDKWDFLITRTNAEIYVLDVQKNGNLYRSYNSSTQDGVYDLFTEIEFASKEMPIEKYKKLEKFIGKLPTCRDITGSTYNVAVSGYGCKTSGSAFIKEVQLSTVSILPNSLIFGPTPYPWSGYLSSITTDNGDGSYVRQQVSGEFPTNWGYAFAGFSPSLISSISPPLKFKFQVSNRRETNDGVVLNMDLILNNSVVYGTTTSPTTSYTLFDSGFQPITISEPITQMSLRMSMFTNTGDLAPRALRISFVKIFIQGFVIVP